MKSNFEGLAEYAQELKNSLVDNVANEERDKEYNRLVPTDFYYRNVENITPKHAFHMVLLQFFAKNEDWMVDNDLLVNGGLKVYIGDGPQNIAKLLCRLIGDL